MWEHRQATCPTPGCRLLRAAPGFRPVWSCSSICQVGGIPRGGRARWGGVPRAGMARLGRSLEVEGPGEAGDLGHSTRGLQRITSCEPHRYGNCSFCGLCCCVERTWLVGQQNWGGTQFAFSPPGPCRACGTWCFSVALGVRVRPLPP